MCSSHQSRLLARVRLKMWSPDASPQAHTLCPTNARGQVRLGESACLLQSEPDVQVMVHQVVAFNMLFRHGLRSTAPHGDGRELFSAR